MDGKIDINLTDIRQSKELLLQIREQISMVEPKTLRLRLNIIIDMAFHSLYLCTEDVPDKLAHMENIKANMKMLRCLPFLGVESCG